MPASISLEIISSLSLAGPSVHTILVFLIILFSSLNGRHSQTARHTLLFYKRTYFTWKAARCQRPPLLSLQVIFFTKRQAA